MQHNIDLSTIQNHNLNDDDLFISDDESTAPKKQQNNTADAFEQMIYRTPAPTADDIIYKQKLISKIIQYKQLFLTLLVNVSIEDIENKSIPELEQLLYKVKDIVQNRNMLSQCKKFTQMAPLIVEHVGTKYTPMKLKGYANALNNNEEYEMIVNECLLEYDIIDNIKINPINRLAYTMLSTAVLVHQVNTMKEQQEMQQLNKQPSEQFTDRFKDI